MQKPESHEWQLNSFDKQERCLFLKLLLSISTQHNLSPPKQMTSSVLVENIQSLKTNHQNFPDIMIFFLCDDSRLGTGDRYKGNVEIMW